MDHLVTDITPPRPDLERRGSMCPDCRPAGAASPSPAALELLHALLTSDWERADASDVRSRREASGLVAAHLQWHLERGLRSLPLVERV